jgi:hypothetical protein
MVCFDVHYVQSRPAPRDGKEKLDLRPDAGNAGPELAQRGRLPLSDQPAKNLAP